jgi:hypothetical protein
MHPFGSANNHDCSSVEWAEAFSMHVLHSLGTDICLLSLDFSLDFNPSHWVVQGPFRVVSTNMASNVSEWLFMALSKKSIEACGVDIIPWNCEPYPFDFSIAAISKISWTRSKHRECKHLVPLPQ